MSEDVLKAFMSLHQSVAGHVATDREAAEAAERAQRASRQSGVGLAPGQPFASVEEREAAFRDPRYGKSEAYRKEVAARALGSIQARARFGK